MIQEIIALTVVALAIAYTVYAVVKSLRKKNESSCGKSCGCNDNSKLRKKN